MNKRSARAEALWRAGKWLISDLGSGAQATGDYGSEEDEAKVAAEITAIAERLIDQADALGFDYRAVEDRRRERAGKGES